jgi:hypothetical protein
MCCDCHNNTHERLYIAKAGSHVDRLQIVHSYNMRCTLIMRLMAACQLTANALMVEQQAKRQTWRQ